MAIDTFQSLTLIMSRALPTRILDIVFEDCFLYVEFCHSKLTNAKFISFNIKEIDLEGTNLTTPTMTKCLIENAGFANAIVDEFNFFENYSFGATLSKRILKCY